MAAFTEGKQKVFDILQKYSGNDLVYYGIGIGHGYSIIGRKNKGRIELLELDYSNNYELNRSKFIGGYTKLMLPDPPKVYTPDHSEALLQKVLFRDFVPK